jgi:hypothetical protein
MIPVYNCVKYLRQTLERALSQGYGQKASRSLGVIAMVSREEVCSAIRLLRVEA